jgi:uncharacterized protein YecE (DUF72 family)
LNNTFYRLPERSTFSAWGKTVPPRFVIAVKASRFLTHMKRLRDPAEPLARLFSRAAGLRGHLGPVLYQLPATLTLDVERLETFLKALPRRSQQQTLLHVMEFRHPSWYRSDTFDLLQKHGVALCLHDKLGSTIQEPFVGPFVYVRFHGPTGEYHGSYSARHLQGWAVRLADRARRGQRVFAYFNNDPNATAVANALTLRGRLQELVAERPALPA